MAKGKKKKKSKAELEAERIAAEEEARRLEEERIKQEEEERKRREEEEARLKAEEEERLKLEDERLKIEIDETATFLATRDSQLILEDRKVKAAADWERYLLCIPRPNPVHEPEMSTWYQDQEGRKDDSLVGTLDGCQDNELVVEETEGMILQMQEQGQTELVSKYEGYVRKLRSLTARRMDRVSAHLLQHTDDYVNERNEAQVTEALGPFKYGLWVNVAKNPRLKMIEMPALGVVAELPKSLALASIAIRFTHVAFDDLSASATDEHMALGGVFAADLLALPPPSKKVKGWTLRTVSPLTHNVQKLPYPIPPAGADHSAAPPGQTAAAPPPMGLTYPLPEHLIIHEGEEPQVGWWDAENSRWCVDGVSETKFDPETRLLSFQTIKLTSLALIQSRVRLLPYKGWSLRPSGGQRSCAVLTLQVGLPDPIEIEVGRGYCKYLSPAYPQLDVVGVTGVEMGARRLLKMLSTCGLHLLPTDRDAKFAGTTPKTREVLDVVFTDVAMLADQFLVASSRWNVNAGADNCLFRIKEVTDPARTRPQDVEKYFGKEKEEYNVRTLLRKAKGCSVVALRDLDTELTPEKVSASPQHNEFHSSVLTALKANPGPAPLVGRAKAEAEAAAEAGGGEEEPPPAPPTPKGDGEGGEGGEGAEGEEGEPKGPPPPPPPPASEETLLAVQGSDAIFTETVKYVLQALGVFSFG